jgi:hypothetical protein
MSESWNYVQNGKPQGPVTEAELKQLIATGQVPGDGLVWSPGMAGWVKASQVPGLALPPPAPELPGNPFDPPRAAVLAVPEPSSMEARAAVAGALDALRATKPWARFLGVLGILGTVLMVALAILMVSLSRGPFKAMPPAMRLVMPVLYLVMAALQLPPVVFLNRYATRIGTLLKRQTPGDLAGALEAQKAFWKYVGISALVVLCIYVVLALFAAGMGVFATLARHH